MNRPKTKLWLALSAACLLASQSTALAQTDQDAIMMPKNNLCAGVMYEHSSWKNYWEGNYQRDKKNLGTVSSSMYGIMPNYGITDKLNVMASLNYVQTNCSAGTMHGEKGIQDLSLWLKWMPLEKKIGKGNFTGYVLGGGSLPVTNYAIDYLPLAIGSGSKTLSGRLMVDYQYNKLFATGSMTYTYRSNVKIDRTAYYTTQLVQSNEVKMPDVYSYAVRAGYRGKDLIAEAVLMGMQTLGGFDIRRNDMPFPSNKMEAVSLGVHAKYEIPKILGIYGLAVTGGASYVLEGRNYGQATSFDIGIYYVMDFSKKIVMNVGASDNNTQK
jgi:hypothetical protein